jgi:hypothetical protein
LTSDRSAKSPPGGAVDSAREDDASEDLRSANVVDVVPSVVVRPSPPSSSEPSVISGMFLRDSPVCVLWKKSCKASRTGRQLM